MVEWTSLLCWYWSVAAFTGAIIVTLLLILTIVDRVFLRRKYPVFEAKDKVIIITGASMGIGQEVALQWSAQKPKLVLGARSVSKLEKTKEECLARGASDVLCVQCDVQSRQDCLNLVEQTIKKFGPTIDVLCHNAGITFGSLFENLPADSPLPEEIFNTNVLGPIHLTRYALPHVLKSSNGRIVAISSGAGKGPIPFRTLYCSSKFAMHGFFESLRSELENYKITSATANQVAVTMVCPGPVRTSINLNRKGGNVGGFDEKKAMAVEECARQIIDGVTRGDRNVFPHKIVSIASFFNTLLPSIAERLTLKQMSDWGMFAISQNDKKGN